MEISGTDGLPSICVILLGFVSVSILWIKLYMPYECLVIYRRPLPSCDVVCCLWVELAFVKLINLLSGCSCTLRTKSALECTENDVCNSGIKLEARNRTICTACILAHRAIRHEDSHQFCPYNIAASCILIAAKSEEDDVVGMRDVVNTTYSVTHPDDSFLEIGSTLMNLRVSLAKMEYITLRLLKFRLDSTNPHNFLCLYVSALKHWSPQEFAGKKVGELSFILLRDAHVEPEWILAHNPQTIAIVCLSIALRVFQIIVDIPWYQIFYERISRRKLAKLEKEYLELILRVW